MSEKESQDRQDKIIELLEEILRWTRLQGVKNAKTILVETLTTDTLKIAYQLSDSRSSYEVAKACGITAMTVTNYWKRWFTLGIVQPSRKYKRRFERTFSLEDLGIEIPHIEASTKVKRTKESKLAQDDLKEAKANGFTESGVNSID